MKDSDRIIRKGVFFIALLLPVIVNGQVDKKAAEKKKMESAIAAAQANVAKYERQLALSDSLIQTGTTAMTEAESEFASLDSDRKKCEKDYATEKKLLTKLANSSDKEEALKAKADLKTLETNHKGQLKELDTKVKTVNKKFLTGENNIKKGKEMKKPAKDGLSTAQDALEAAEQKMAEAENPEERNESGKKKK